MESVELYTSAYSGITKKILEKVILHQIHLHRFQLPLTVKLVFKDNRVEYTTIEAQSVAEFCVRGFLSRPLINLNQAFKIVIVPNISNQI